MTNFAPHIARGLLAAENAECERAEIRSILDRLDSEIRTVTLGNAHLHVGEFDHPEDEKVMSIADLKQRLVVRSTTDKTRGRIIAGWDPSRDGGYLVSIVYDEMSMACHNGGQLVEELEALMHTPRVGRAIRELTG
ncbi:hypothetical protein ACNI65_21055 [Roseateles sp. So40a]|uniref:hypothetical protein n=1 Tax=Roseateles sp. So40a TaxID=3400226 RepID=UPI003A898D7B